jgi:hypothetical protein
MIEQSQQQNEAHEKGCPSNLVLESLTIPSLSDPGLLDMPPAHRALVGTDSAAAAASHRHARSAQDTRAQGILRRYAVCSAWENTTKEMASVKTNRKDITYRRKRDALSCS